MTRYLSNDEIALYRVLDDIEYKDERVSYLADTIESENIYAKRYARFVMRDVVCCENSDDLEQYSKSVTKDRLRFHNFCLQRMKKQVLNIVL